MLIFAISMEIKNDISSITAIMDKIIILRNTKIKKRLSDLEPAAATHSTYPFNLVILFYHREIKM